MRQETLMNLVCRLLGHKASRDEVRLDPKTFQQFSFCRRCRSRLARSSGANWRALQEGRAGAD
jgi:hypothetical protein